METAPQFSAKPQASGTAAGASREGASAGSIHLDGDLPSQNLLGGNPDHGGTSDDEGNERRKRSKPRRKERKAHRRKGRKDGCPPDGYSSPSTLSSSESESASESEPLTAPTPTFGPKQKKVSVWKPTNQWFRGVCNYRAYRLVDTDKTLDDKVYATTRKRVQYLLVVMGEYKFSGVDLIRVIGFLARCKETFDNANMTEAMALMALPHVLAPPAKEAYESQLGLHRKSQGIESWAAAVNWLLHTYATNLEIERALTALRELCKEPANWKPSTLLECPPPSGGAGT